MIKVWLKKEISEKYPNVEFDILTPPDDKMGDYSINLAFVLAKKENKNPREVAQKIVNDLMEDDSFKEKKLKMEEKNGFINFYLSEDRLRNSLVEIIKEGERFGDSQIGKGIKINLEFVSANPTGPLTVGNARAASFGDTLGNILKKTGHEVVKEYYINDIGNQVNLLGMSIASHLVGSHFHFIEENRENFYKGEYVKKISKERKLKMIIKEILGEDILKKDSQFTLDEFTKMANICAGYGIERIKKGAKKSMTKMGIKFNVWFSERTLHDNGEVNEVLTELKRRGFVVEEDGAKWLKMNGDQKAVLVKSDGSTTYLANDIAYTKNKFERGFTSAINIWGADHHGDVIRLKTGVSALGYDPDRLEILLHQLVAIKESGELQKMSKRAGRFVLLDDLLSEVGKDAVRFFFLTRDLNTHMEFDVDLAKKQSKENPVFYIQYAYSRLNSIFGKITNHKSQITNKTQITKPEILNLLKEEEELRLLKGIAKFPEVVESVAENYQVHQLAQYTLNLAGDFHKFYEKHHVIQDDDVELQSARLLLSQGVHTVLKICLSLMGLSTPERM